jgi:hypothetical protein
MRARRAANRSFVVGGIIRDARVGQAGSDQAPDEDPM